MAASTDSPRLIEDAVGYEITISVLRFLLKLDLFFTFVPVEAHYMDTGMIYMFFFVNVRQSEVKFTV